MGEAKLTEAIQDVLNRGDKAVVAYIMGGDGGLEALTERISYLESIGVTAIEVGVPFSDPVADGPTIQEAGIRALKEKVTLEDILQVLEDRKETRKIPIVLMTYLNPIYVYGIDAFAERCKKAGVDGIIIPDLPMEEEYLVEAHFKRQHLAFIRLVAITSSEERIRNIASKSQGFLYAVTVKGTTGERVAYHDNLENYLTKLKSYTSVPVLAGFGVSTPSHVSDLGQYCDGVIIGSKIISLFQENNEEYIKQFVQASSKKVESN